MNNEKATTPQGHLYYQSQMHTHTPCPSTSMYSTIPSQLIYLHAVYIKDGVTIILYLLFISHTQAQMNISGRRYKTIVLLVRLSVVMQDDGLDGIS
jgi:flagellar biosynthesis regulator FlbT